MGVETDDGGLGRSRGVKTTEQRLKTTVGRMTGNVGRTTGNARTEDRECGMDDRERKDRRPGMRGRMMGGWGGVGRGEANGRRSGHCNCEGAQGTVMHT